MVSRSAPGNTNRVAVPYKDKDALARARRKAAQYGVAGARGGSYFNRNKFGSEDIFDPITGVSGAYNLSTTDYNPENIKYEQRTVPTIRGGMVSGGQSNIGNSFAGILEAIKGSVTAAPTTEFDAAMQEKYKNNPRAIGAAQQRLSPEDKYQMVNQRENAQRDKEYSNLLSTLKAAGLTEEELYRNAVVSPNGQVNLNPNAQATIAQLGNAANSLRLLDLSGMGAGKAVSAGARVASKATVRGLDNLIPRIASIANNPTLINAGMNTVRSAAAGAPLEQSVASGIASLVSGNKPTGELRATAEDIMAINVDPYARMSPTGDRKAGRVIVDRQVSQANSRSLKAYNELLAKEGKSPVQALPDELKLTHEDFLTWAEEAGNHPGNQEYIKSRLGTKDGSTWEVSHPIVGIIGKAGKADSLVGGEANRLEQAARMAGAEIKSWDDVMQWAIDNKPQYAGETVKSLAGKTGAAHLIG
jgi:hypothetical protein